MDVMDTVTVEEVMKSTETHSMGSDDGYFVARAAVSEQIPDMVWAAQVSRDANTLRFLAAQDADIVRSATARNKYTPSDAIDVLFNDPAFRVVRALAGNKSTPVSKLVDIWHRNLHANDSESINTAESLIQQDKFPNNILEDFVREYRSGVSDVHYFTSTRTVEIIVSTRMLSEKLCKDILQFDSQNQLFMTSTLISNRNVSMGLILENLPSEMLPRYFSALCSREQDIRDYLSSKDNGTDYSHLPTDMLYSIIGMR